MVVIVANPCTSVLAGFGVFSVLGHLSHKSGIPVQSITESGYITVHYFLNRFFMLKYAKKGYFAVFDFSRKLEFSSEEVPGIFT